MVSIFCLASCPYTTCEASVVHFTALLTPCERAGNLGSSSLVPAVDDFSSSSLVKHSVSAGSQTGVCERSIKFDQCVAAKLIAVIFFSLFGWFTSSEKKII